MVAVAVVAVFGLLAWLCRLGLGRAPSRGTPHAVRASGQTLWTAQRLPSPGHATPHPAHDLERELPWQPAMADAPGGKVSAFADEPLLGRHLNADFDPSRGLLDTVDVDDADIAPPPD